jgi:hypothetical protein
MGRKTILATQQQGGGGAMPGLDVVVAEQTSPVPEVRDHAARVHGQPMIVSAVGLRLSSVSAHIRTFCRRLKPGSDQRVI